MTYKSATQPLCRYCGKPIGKYTTTTYFNGRMVGSRRETPRTKEEAQALVNQQIVSLRYSRYDPDSRVKTVGEPEFDFVQWVGLWDGESYKDEFFCSDVDAIRFAYLFAKTGKMTTAYAAAANEREIS